MLDCSRVRSAQQNDSNCAVNDDPKPSIWHRLERKWNDIQVGRQGAYSVERLENLDHYCKTTSLTRVISVCIFTPVPVLVTTILLECSPLRPPSEGWSENWVFWIRFAVVIFLVNFGFLSEFNISRPGLSFVVQKRLLVSTIFTVVSIGFYLILAVCIGFPIPFAWHWGIIPTAIMPVLLIPVLGREPFKKMSPFCPHIQRLSHLACVRMVLITIFPVCKVLYEGLPIVYRGIVIVLLPLWKLAGKLFIVSSMRSFEDFVPESVAVIVDFFSALFVSVCMYSSGSIVISFLVIALDVVQSLFELHEVRTNSNIVVALLQRYKVNRTTNNDQVEILGNAQSSIDLVTLILDVCRNPSAYNVTSFKNVRLWASLPQIMSDEKVIHLKLLGKFGFFGRECFLQGDLANRFQSTRRSISASTIAVAPIPTTPRLGLVTSINLGEKEKAEIADTLVTQGLQLLFHCEYLTLVEYIECIVPLVFVTYKSVLEFLPNVVYYPGGAGTWGLTAVVNILIFSLLEVASFVLLSAFLQRKFASSSLYQLAFVLETALVYPGKVVPENWMFVAL